MRIQKLIASSGVASRREAERMVIDGRVKVNGETIYRPGHPVNVEKDKVTIDDKALPPPKGFVYYAINKPRGYITTRDDPEERKTVHEILSDVNIRMEPMGRLDFNTTGLLLFTNNGEINHKLTHPSLNVPKKYKVKVWKRPSDRKLNLLRNGIKLEDGKSKPLKVRVLEQTDTDNTWLEVTVTEGRNRLIRRLFETIGHPVSKLRRTSFATISLGDLPLGAYRPLTGKEISRITDIANGVDPQNAGKTARYKKGFAKPKPKPVKPGHKKRNRPIKRK